jgi:hypothetical protein
MKLSFCIIISSVLLSTLYSGCRPVKKRFTESDILQQLDTPFNQLHHKYTYQDFIHAPQHPSAITYTFLLDLEHGYCLTASNRIHLYADSTRWAIVFEKSGYQNRGSDAEIELDYFGNCFIENFEKFNGTVYNSNSSNVSLITAGEYERIRNKVGTGMETFEYISPDAEYVMVRNKKIKIEHDPQKYFEDGVGFDEKENPKHLIGFGDLVRYLSDTDPQAINATEREIRAFLPAGLPKLMTLHRFHFESIYNPNNFPSKSETYRLIAKILVKRDTSLWRPKLKPNNHWSNWESGNL